MHNKRTWIDKLSDFISGKGFYLVVLICVAAIALSGWYLVQGVRDGLGETLDQPVSGSAAIVEPSAAPSVRPTVRPSDSPAASSAKITTPPASEAPSASVPSEAPAPSAAPPPLCLSDQIAIWPAGAGNAGESQCHAWPQAGTGRSGFPLPR